MTSISPNANVSKPQTEGVATTQPVAAPAMTVSAPTPTSASAATSTTAVGSSDGKPVDPRDPKVYEDWYPGDATKEGRPAWWNRVFCCGYGIGCLLCPCGSWTCKQERL